MFDTIFGLPVHPLIVHATVVVVPSAAFAVALAALWPRFRRWAGFFPLLLSAASVVLVPVTTQSGEALENHLPRTALLEKHTELADGLFLPVLVLAVAAAALCWVYLKENGFGERPALSSGPVGRAIGRPGRPGLPLMSGIVVVALLSVVATTVQVARIGHSGAKAAWSGVATSTSQGGSARPKP